MKSWKNFIGMRVLKTVIAVFLCFILAKLRNTDPQYSAVAAIISMKTNHKGGMVAGKNRLTGTGLGGLFGLIAILLVGFINIDPAGFLAYLIYSLFLIPIVYLNLFLDSSESVSLSCVVFIGIVLSTSDVSPLLLVLKRLFETSIGVGVSVLVNMSL